MALTIMRFAFDDPSKRDLSNKGGLKVIAAGLPRCGTSSLQFALETYLALGPCMHFANISPHPHLLKLVFEAQNETDKARRQKILHKIFDGYVATADVPGAWFVDDLMEMYPGAKVILNKRNSAQEWHRSFTATITFCTQTPFLLTTCLIPTFYWIWKTMTRGSRTLLGRRFGLGGGQHGVYVLELYDLHNNWVGEVAKRNGSLLLEWQPEQGWEPLCKFLGKPVPDKVFPQLNEKKTMYVMRTVTFTLGLLAWAALLSSAALAYRGWLWFLKK